MMAVKKKDIYDRNLEWIKYIGWNAEWMLYDGIVWIDSFEDISKTGFNIIGFDQFPMPICCDPPQYVMDFCHCDNKDLEILKLFSADDVIGEISSTICDHMEE